MMTKTTKETQVYQANKMLLESYVGIASGKKDPVLVLQRWKC